MSQSVLIIERPGTFRDALVSEFELSGSAPHVRDDAMDALATLKELAPDLVLVSEDPGPPGAASVCRLVRRNLNDAAVFRIGDPSQRDPIDAESPFVPRALGPIAIARFLLQRAESPRSANDVVLRAWDAPLGSLELGPLLLAISQRFLTGRLILSAQGGERELHFARGMLVNARSSVFSERLGPIAVRSGQLNQGQVERALDLARIEDLRLGEALVSLGLLDPPRLFGLLCSQLSEQVAAAANGGASHARFLIDEHVIGSGLLLRMHPVTALLGAVRRTSREDVGRVLEQLAERTLSADAVPALVLRWLEDSGVSEPARLLGSMSNVRHLRERLRERLPKGAGAEGEQADAVALALLRVGALRLPGRASLAPADLRSGLTTLSPPSVASSVVRCARASFDDWAITALSQPRTPFEERLDAYLHGPRASEAARAAALSGPVAELDEVEHDLIALQVRASGALSPWAWLQMPRGSSVRDVRLTCHALHERLDGRLEARNATEALRIVEIRNALDRALALLEPGEAKRSSPVPAAVLPEAVQRAVHASMAPQAPRPTAPDGGDAALLALVEPLLEQSRWRELRELLMKHAEGGETTKLPPAFALLYAIALKEGSGPESSMPGAPRTDAEALGIAAVSEMLDVPAGSAAALVVAKRALRRRPIEWTRKASGRASVLFVLLALLCGAGVGFLLSPQLMTLFLK